jgi:hypothetical protein
VIHVSRPRRDLNFSAQLNGSSQQSRTSDMQTVSYFLAGNGGSGLHAAVASQGMVTPAGVRVPAAGLARLAGDRFALKMSDEKGDVAALASQAQILAPEVTLLQFRYFDGAEWLSSWDSVALNEAAQSGTTQSAAIQPTLPRAVEIQIGLLPRQSPSHRRVQLSGQTAAPHIFRLVVAIPIRS